MSNTTTISLDTMVVPQGNDLRLTIFQAGGVPCVCVRGSVNTSTLELDSLMPNEVAPFLAETIRQLFQVEGLPQTARNLLEEVERSKAEESREAEVLRAMTMLAPVIRLLDADGVIQVPQKYSEPGANYWSYAFQLLPIQRGVSQSRCVAKSRKPVSKAAKRKAAQKARRNSR